MWAKEFELEPNDTGSILRMYSQLLELVYATRRRIEGLKGSSPVIHLKQFEKIERAFFSVNFESAFGPFKQQIDEAVLHGLLVCADLLAQSNTEVVLTGEQLDSIRKEVESLFEDVVSSDLDPDLRLLIMDNLELIRRAIAEYRIRGADGLRRATEAGFGAVFLRTKDVEAEKDNPLVVRFLQFLVTVNTWVEPLVNVKELVGPLFALAFQRDDDPS